VCVVRALCFSRADVSSASSDCPVPTSPFALPARGVSSFLHRVMIVGNSSSNDTATTHAAGSGTGINSARGLRIGVGGPTCVELSEILGSVGAEVRLMQAHRAARVGTTLPACAAVRVRASLPFGSFAVGRVGRQERCVRAWGLLSVEPAGLWSAVVVHRLCSCLARRTRRSSRRGRRAQPLCAS
jgi:hypothetical protein